VNKKKSVLAKGGGERGSRGEKGNREGALSWLRGSFLVELKGVFGGETWAACEKCLKKKPLCRNDREEGVNSKGGDSLG